MRSPSAPELWIFGFGSLMWNPGFPYAGRHLATIYGMHRAFCIYSVHYRGQAHRPGLVLGLDTGGSCTGIAYRVTATDAARVLAYLRARELVTGVYREAIVPCLVGGGRDGEGATEEVRAHAFVVERGHSNYAGALSLACQSRIIKAARGRAGTNLDYFANTLIHMRQARICDVRLERLATVIGNCRVRASERGTRALLTASGGPAPCADWRGKGARLTARGNRFAYRRLLGGT